MVSSIINHQPGSSPHLTDHQFSSTGYGHAQAPKPVLLVLDDEEGPRVSVDMVFRQDFEVLCASTISQALKFVETKPVQVAILDIMIPNGSGIDGLKQIKAINPAVEIIMFTAFATVDTAAEAIRNGACDYQLKPFDVSALRASVYRALQLNKLTQSLMNGHNLMAEANHSISDSAVRTEVVRFTGDLYENAVSDLQSLLGGLARKVKTLSDSLNKDHVIHGGQLEFLRNSIKDSAREIGVGHRIATAVIRCCRLYGSKNSPRDLIHVLTTIRDLFASRGGFYSDFQILIRDELNPIAELSASHLTHAITQIVENCANSGTAPVPIRIRYDILPTVDAIPTTRDESENFIPPASGIYDSGIIALTIEDWAGGIDLDLLPHIFEPYFTTREDDPTSLGLCVVARLLGDVGAGIRVRTTMGVGTAYTLYLPAVESAPAPLFEEAPQHRLPTHQSVGAEE